mgnify:FL=1
MKGSSVLDKLTQKYKCRTYDFSEGVYVNSKTPIKVICPTHGEFYKSYEKLMHREQSCSKCSKEIYNFLKLSKSLSMLYAKQGAKVHYSIEDLSKYPATVKVYCDTHGESTTNHEAAKQSSFGCLQCSIEHTANLKRSTIEDFIVKAQIVHGTKYDYSKSVYTEAKNKITISCPTHGDFTQLVSGHLSGYGCKLCANHGKGRVDMNVPCKLYYFNVEGTSLYKIGITTQSINERYRTKFDREQINIVFCKEYTTGREAYEKEQELLNTYNHLLYQGPKVLGSGNTELFAEDIFKGNYKDYYEDIS